MKIKNNIKAIKPGSKSPSDFSLENMKFPCGNITYDFIDISKDDFVNWPMLYILISEKQNKAYVGQTTGLNSRLAQHSADPEKKIFNSATSIYHPEFNGSVITDYEHRLIMHMQADGLYQLTNKNEGWYDRNYFSKEEYSKMYINLWKAMRKFKLADKTIEEIEKSAIFKYSPFKELNAEQESALKEILKQIERKFSETQKSLCENNKSPIVIEGMPGTGKTILLIYLLKYLRDHSKYKDLKIKIIQPETTLRATLQEVCKTIPGLNKNDILSPTDITKEQFGYVNGKNDYDILLVDEAHKLKQRQNIVNYKSYDDANKKIYPRKTKEQLNKITQLDWILKEAKIPIFFYDPLQSIRPSGIYKKDYDQVINGAGTTFISLSTQMRVKAGECYLKYIQDVLNFNKPKPKKVFKNYELILHNDFDEFYLSFENKLKNNNLTRLLAGISWKEWNKDKAKPDIVLGSHKLYWNEDVKDWVGKGLVSNETAHEVGCIHKIQGYDLSYAYVIIGNDLMIDGQSKKICCNKDCYYDENGIRNASSEEIDQYVKNIYYVLLTRGIYGTHVYVCDPALRDYFKNYIHSV